MTGESGLEKTRSLNLRKRVAREAAILLYESQEKEYKQAKKSAAKTLRARILPSNLEVAKELDEIAAEKEGVSRHKLLIRLRKEALEIMEALKGFDPRLVGSVWRGTAYRDSDIDILAFSFDVRHVLDVLRESGFKIASSGWRSVTKKGRKRSSFHVHLVLSSDDEAEVVVRHPDRIGQFEQCEIYGDAATGLDYSELEEVLEKRPLQRFMPS